MTGWREWSCGFCGQRGVVPQDVEDEYAWMAQAHGLGKCVPVPGFVDGGGI
jgi:hypothetical protein